MIDLDALAGNVRVLLSGLARGARLMAVVKADGYGHGAELVAATALAAGAAELAVATVEEGLGLRAAGIAAPILVLGPIDPSELGAALDGRLALTLADLRFSEWVLRAIARRPGEEPYPLHVKVDTGMRRFGAMPAAGVAIARRVAGAPRAALAGLFTHFADADGPDEAFTRQQAAALDACVAALAAEGIRPGAVHAANSAATLRSPRYHHDLVRVGIALYGLPPGGTVRLPAELRPALTLHSRIARLIRLAPGDTVSYGRTYRAAGEELAGLVPIGYADGFRRALSNRGWMGVGGQPAPVRGRVCMDQTVIGLPVGLGIELGAPVTVFGAGEAGAPTVAEVAEELGTIAYEVVTGLARRVPRIYVAGGRVVAVQDGSGLRRLLAEAGG